MEIDLRNSTFAYAVTEFPNRGDRKVSYLIAGVHFQRGATLADWRIYQPILNGCTCDGDLLIELSLADERSLTLQQTTVKGRLLIRETQRAERIENITLDSVDVRGFTEIDIQSDLVHLDLRDSSISGQTEPKPAIGSEMGRVDCLEHIGGDVRTNKTCLLFRYEIYETRHNIYAGVLDWSRPLLHE